MQKFLGQFQKPRNTNPRYRKSRDDALTFEMTEKVQFYSLFIL